MDATTSPTSSPTSHGASRRKPPHTLSFINNVQTAIAAIEHRLEHNPSAQPPPPQRNEYPAQHGNSRDKIYSDTVKHLEQPVLLPHHNSASHLTAPTVDADAVLSPQSTFSSLAIDEAVSVTSDYQVSATFGSPVPPLSGSTTRSIADIVQHFESNTTPSDLSRDASTTKHPSSKSVTPIVDRLEAEQRLSDASKPPPTFTSVEQLQHPTTSKSSVSFAHETDTVITASKESTSAMEDDVDLSSVGATVDPSEFDFFSDEADRISHRALSIASISKSERDARESMTSPLPPSNASDAAVQTTVPQVGADLSGNGVDELEGSTVNVDALSKSLHVDADNLEVTDESVARAIETLDIYSKAAGIQTSQDGSTEFVEGVVSSKEHCDMTTSGHGADVARGGDTHQEDISAPMDDSSYEAQKSESGASMPHAAVQVSGIVDRAQPSVPRPVVENSHIPEVESNSRSFTITSITVSTPVEQDNSRLERDSAIEAVITRTTNEIRDSKISSPALATGEYSTLNPSSLQDTAVEPRSLTTLSSAAIADIPNSSAKNKMAATDGSPAGAISPADIGSVANVSNVRKAESYDDPASRDPAGVLSIRQAASSTREDASEDAGDASDAVHEITEKVAKIDIHGVSDKPPETVSSTNTIPVDGRTAGFDGSATVSTTRSTTTSATAQQVDSAGALPEVSVVDVRDEDPGLEADEGQEAFLRTRSEEKAGAQAANEHSQSAASSRASKHARAETKRTLTPSRIPRRSHNLASPAHSSASSTRMERLESETDANPLRRRFPGSMTPTSLSPGSRIMSSRLPPSKASSSGTVTPLSRSAATSPKGLSPLRGRGSSSSQQQPHRPGSLAPARNLSNERKPVKLPRVAELLNSRSRDRASLSPGSRLPRGSTFSGVSPVRSAGSPGPQGSARRLGTASTPVTPSDRPKASPQGMDDIGPLHAPLRRTLSFNNNRRATLSPSNLRGAAASFRLQEMRAPGAGAGRRATLSETRRPPRQRVTVPQPFNLTGAELQARALKQLEEQKRKREEMERRRRVFKARPMPDFSNPSPKPFF